MATITTYEQICEVYRKVYRELREAGDENAPNSYTWIGATFEDLLADIGGDPERLRLDPEEPDRVLGDLEADTVGWIWECEGRDLAEVKVGADEEELVEHLRLCMGLDALTVDPEDEA